MQPITLDPMKRGDIQRVTIGNRVLVFICGRLRAIYHSDSGLLKVSLEYRDQELSSNDWYSFALATAVPEFKKRKSELQSYFDDAVLVLDAPRADLTRRIRSLQGKLKKLK